jgi:hypothetical protein
MSDRDMDGYEKRETGQSELDRNSGVKEGTRYF